MGLLSQGKPLEWDETKKYAKYVQQRGIAQFINIYNESKDRADACFKWGDEVEYILVKFDHERKAARVSLSAEDVFRRLDEQKKGMKEQPKSFWNPEFASYMVEGTPGHPYIGDGLLVSSLCDIEDNMKYRRQEVLRVLGPSETVMSITSFPRLGCPNFTDPLCQLKPDSSASGSLFFPDEAIYNGHPRFKTLVKNIRSRRKRKVIINLPIYKDVKTPNPFMEMFNDSESRRAVKPNSVYMDAMGFGMGCCCLQLTMQATHLEEAKRLYDQLAPITPIALALSAASPIYRGLLTDRDCRWDVISSSVDDRTREELSETNDLKESMYRIAKSRYDSISCYLSGNGQKYNDIPLVYNKDYYDLMVANKVDPAVARHVAHLFIRDPITLYKEKLEQSDSELDHFENIQSTNWQTMRFKPPPSVDSSIGWRVEFRPLEAQTSDFENAAFVVFITLLSRVILAYKLNFLMPISLVDENMIEAQKRDAVKASKFWFRSDILHRSSSKEPLSTVLENCNNTNSSNNCGSALGSISHESSTHVLPSMQATQINGNQSMVMTTNSNIITTPSRLNRMRAFPHRHHNGNHHHHHHHLNHHHLNHNGIHHHHQYHYGRHYTHHMTPEGQYRSIHHNHQSSRVVITTPTVNNRTNMDNGTTMNINTMMNDGSTTTSGTNDGTSVRIGNSRGNNFNDSCVKMTIDEIINGRDGFVGIMPIVCHYIESFEDGSNTESIMKIKRYLRLVADRASGKAKTTARLMRDFVSAHPQYSQDSVVNDEVTYDLLQMLDKIGKSEIICTDLIGQADSPLVNGNKDSARKDNYTNRVRSHSSNGFVGPSSAPASSLSRRTNSP